MIRLLGAPPDALRGDIVAQNAPRVPSLDIIGAHLLHWVQQLETIGPDEVSMRADTTPILVGRLAELMGLHVDYQQSRNTSDPFTTDEKTEFQLRASTAVATSNLLMLPPVEEFSYASLNAAPTQVAPINFDPGDRDLRWHVLSGEETDLIPGYVPSEMPDVWYEGKELFVHIQRPAHPTQAFLESYQEFFETQFEPEHYATLTPVSSGNILQAL